ncbi:hypothetical protein [Nocardioides ultimimeridianus]
MSEQAPAQVTYAEWGERFFEYAVTLDRVLDGVNVLAGRPIDVGPLGVGPGRIAKVTAKGAIGTATGRRVGGMPVRFEVTLPVRIEFAIDLGMDLHRFDAHIEVPLVITAHGRSDLSIAIDVTPPSSREIVVDLVPQGLRASLIRRAAGVDVELKRFVAKYVAREIEKPHVAAARVIDVRTALDHAAGGVVPKEESTIAAEMTQDLPDALRTEIEQAAEQFLEEGE